MMSIADSIKARIENDRQWGDGLIKGLVWLMIGLVYIGALTYAGVRSFSLFLATIAPEYQWLVPLGVLTTELSAVALPLAFHYACAPGRQRNWVKAFTAVDLFLIACNCILDAARESGQFVPNFFQLYGVFVLPTLPLVCLVGWLVFVSLSDASKHRDMIAIVQSNTRDTLLAHVQDAIATTDITKAVQAAADEYGRALVAQTLGSYTTPASAQRPPEPEARAVLPPPNGHVERSFNADLEPVEVIRPKNSRGGRAS
jgi:hypothetical protein